MDPELVQWIRQRNEKALAQSGSAMAQPSWIKEQWVCMWLSFLPPSLHLPPPLSLPSTIVTIVYTYDRLLLPWLVHMHLTVRFWWTKLNFLVLFAQCSKDQWICEIINYYVALPLQWLNFTCLLRCPNIFWEGVVQNCLNIAKLH